MDSLRLRFWLSALALGAMEVAGVGLPALLLAEWPEPHRDAIATLGPVAAVALLIWHVAASRWLAPVYRARARLRAGAALDPEPRAAARAAILALPGRGFRLRTALWAMLGVAVALLAARAGLPRHDVAALLAVLAGNGAAIGLFRASWYEWLLERPLRELDAADDPFARFSARHRGRLIRMATLATGLALTVLALFVYFFIPLTLEHYRFVQTAFPLSLLAFHGAAYPLFSWQLRHVRAYLAGDAARAREAYTAGQTLPYRFAGAKALAFALAGAAALAVGAAGEQVDEERAVLAGIAAVIVALGAAVLEALLHRHVMRPFLEQVARAHPEVLRQGRTNWTLRRKMTVGFGGLTLFVGCFSLFWAFLHYRNLAQKFLQAQAERELVYVVESVRPVVGEPEPEAILDLLRSSVAGTEMAMYYVPPYGAAIGAGAPGPAPRLSAPVLASIRRRGRGWLDASDLQMQGAFRPVDANHAHWGQIVALLPGYRGRGPGIEPAIKALLVFFVVLLAAATALVGLAVRDLSAPLRALEARADAMARGDLEQGVPLPADADELGQLAVTLEEMRGSINEKIAALRDLHADLERRVAERTRDLQRSNEELRQALDALRVAQNKLVAQGKMAIVGQLLAGIAHEVNNPVNAIVNTVEPLATAASDLARAGAPDAQAAAQSERELQEMIGVIQRGADRTKKIVQALRNYARGDGEELVEFDLHRGLDEALELLRHELRDGVRVERRYGEVGRVRGYPGQLNQVFLNLLTNAVHALAGRGDGTIALTTRRDGSRVEVEVADNGPGIPEEVLPRVFDPFFSTKPVGQGTGLGLSICQQIAERHGGAIRVESTVGRGATFTVVIPQ